VSAARGSGDLLLEVRGLQTQYALHDGVVKAVDGVDFALRRGRTLCVVGESGCGKSATAHSILQLIEPPGRIVGGEILLHRREAEPVDVLSLRPRSKAMRAIRGKEIGMVFQEPMTSLSPVHTVGDQVTEAMLLHLPVTKREAYDRAVEMLERVRIPNPRRHMSSYPFQLSGGMRQRVAIAAALSCGPDLLIADEPTTALDVTTQAQILELLQDLQEEMDMAIMFITHDLGVVATIADDVVVMYLGTVAEAGDVDAIFHDAKHPYTRALLESVPRSVTGERERLRPISGTVPSPYARPSGCTFHPRCRQLMPGRCDRIVPPPVPVGDGRTVRCLLYGGEEVGVDEREREGAGRGA
jgi:peptide/nickel transport system ATP-binding protein